MAGVDSDRTRLRYDDVGQIDHIEEILDNILPRLPVKTIGACKCISKYLLKVILDPHFANLQLSCSKKNLKYAICSYSRTSNVSHMCLMDGKGSISQSIPLSSIVSIPAPDLICFSNGLMCSVNVVEEHAHEVNIHIINPITWDTVVVPRGSTSEVTPLVGVVFDPKSNDFKIFYFFVGSWRKSGYMFQCEVYNSHSASWRRICRAVRPPDYNPVHRSAARYISIDGRMYWFAWPKFKLEGPTCILSVDINDKFTRIELPTELHPWSFLIEVEGCLAVVHVCCRVYAEQRDGESNRYVQVFKLQNGEWLLKARADMHEMDIRHFNSVTARDREIFFIIKLYDDSFCYILFDLVEGTMKSLDLHDRFEGYSPVAFTFAESLIKCSLM